MGMIVFEVGNQIVAIFKHRYSTLIYRLTPLSDTVVAQHDQHSLTKMERLWLHEDGSDGPPVRQH